MHGSLKKKGGGGFGATPPSPEKKIVEELNSHGKVPSLSPAQENDFFKKMPKDPFSGKQLLFGPPPLPIPWKFSCIHA